MIIAVLVVLGLCFGSFVNALVYRIHEQAKIAKKRPVAKRKTTTNTLVAKNEHHIVDRLSVLHGRSMCPHCKHELSARDLIPIISWLGLGGKCRFCHKRISWQYPLVELVTVGLFVGSYLFWPSSLLHVASSSISVQLFNGAAWYSNLLFVLWLPLLVGLVALLVYDLQWYLLPNRIVYPLVGIAGVYALVAVLVSSKPLTALVNTLLAVAVGGGIFYVIFQISKGKWIGGGDVKLGWLLGLVVATPARSLLFIFLAALLGSLVSVPLLVTKRMQRTSVIPFGPFLIIAAIIVQLFGHAVLFWYQRTFLAFTV